MKKKKTQSKCTLIVGSKIIHLGQGQENVMYLETSIFNKDKIMGLVTMLEKHFRSVRITASRIGFYQPIYANNKKIFFSIESIRGNLSPERIKNIKKFCTKIWDSL